MKSVFGFWFLVFILTVLPNLLEKISENQKPKTKNQKPKTF